MTTKQPDAQDINALAMEACDMWQEHLSTLANDPAARAELTRFLEPQRRLFADWAAIMQQGGTHGSSHTKETSKDSGHKNGAAASTPSGGPAHGDDALRAAQLALRLAELEKRIAKLEGLSSKSSTRTEPK